MPLGNPERGTTSSGFKHTQVFVKLNAVLSQDAVAPLAARELSGKRKRGRTAEEEGEENKVTKRGQEENVCPNGTAEKTTPVRKARGQTKGGQKLFSSGGDATKMKGAGECHCLLCKKNHMALLYFVLLFQNCVPNQ